MAFVFQADRDLNQSLTDVPPNIGPGSYQSLKNKPIKQSVVPFNTQAQRTKSINKNQLPGPGSYNVNFVKAGQKVVVQSISSDVQILELPKQLSVFASKCKRFNEKNEYQTPGPGTYETVSVIRNSHKSIQQENLISHLMKLNRYKSIPSIPCNYQVHGYTDNGELELNVNPQTGFSGLKSDSVGPGQYEIKDLSDSNKNKGVNWHKSKSSKLAPVVSKEQQLIVGPGAYDVEDTQQPLYKLLPSSSFQSNSQRMFDMEKGSKVRKYMKNQYEKKRDELLSSPQFTDLKDDEIEYIEDATPGPGYYYNSQTASTLSKSISKLETQCFGSKSKRFQDDYGDNSIGPGIYNVEKQITVKNLSYKQPPFLSSNSRFDAKMIEKRPGPQSYDPKQTLEQKLIKKLERAPVGKFGYNEPRFETQTDNQQLPGPGSYDYFKSIPENGAQASFKSQARRGIQQSSPDAPAPGSYEINNHTIEKQNKLEEEEDPTLKIQKPPFGSSMPRFKYKDSKIEEEPDDEEIINRTAVNPHKLPFQQKKPAPPFNIQEQRFRYDEDGNKQPGPGQYFDEKQNLWDKKTYNIQFSEV